MKQEQHSVTETHFGKPACFSRTDGNRIYFFLRKPTSYLLSGTIHRVFIQQTQEACVVRRA